MNFLNVKHIFGPIKCALKLLARKREGLRKKTKAKAKKIKIKKVLKKKGFSFTIFFFLFAVFKISIVFLQRQGRIVFGDRAELYSSLLYTENGYPFLRREIYYFRQNPNTAENSIQ
jgi:hypothetical protein